MAESPPGGGGPPDGDDQADGLAKKGASDPLFNPPGLKTRKTVMGLAPAPHLGGASRGPATEAEARKQRVLARIAGMDSKSPPSMETGPPPPVQSSIPPAVLAPGNVYGERFTGPPPPEQPHTPHVKLDHTLALNTAPARPSIGVAATHIGPPAYGQTTEIIPPMSMLAAPRAVSSDGKLPAASGWDVHEAKDAEFVETEIMERAPNTARMARAARVDGKIEPAPAPAAATATTTALAVRAYEPGPRHSLVRLDRRLTILADPHSPRAASFRLLRDSLIAKNMPRVVAIASPSKNDGKTTCATNLALAFAEQATTRVLLVDANFFKPDLAHIFGIDQLASNAPPDAVAWLAPYKLAEITPSLHAAGIVAAPGAPAPRFEQQRFDALIDRLVRASYDYILIDTPAMIGTPSVLQLIATADATLLVVRSGDTTSRDLRRAAEQIPKGKALGVALIDAQAIT